MPGPIATNARGYMLDTVIFNRVQDGALPFAVLSEMRVYSTHIQRDELESVRNESRRTALLATFAAVDAVQTSTRTAIWGDTPWGESSWSADDGEYEWLLARLRELDGKDRGLNQSRDARIAETALKEGLILVTDDKNLARTFQERGGCAIRSKELPSVRERDIGPPTWRPIR